MLKSSTITSELTRRGWKLMNGGPDWDSFAWAGRDPHDVTVKVDYRSHEVVLIFPKPGASHIHFTSYGRLDKRADLQDLEVNAARLQALITLDLAPDTGDTRLRTEFPGDLPRAIMNREAS